jgi:uncharacterized protein YdeI (YjbR/CyaY-like superfamily)
VANGKLAIQSFVDRDEWEAWLEANHLSSSGLWIRFAKKASKHASVSHADALESALCYGWIDGQTDADDEEWWLQKFSPRSKRSIWSRINREKVEALSKRGLMKPSGLMEVARAKEDGRWDSAYDSMRSSVVPDDLQAALDKSPKAKAFFDTLNSKNRYSVLFRIQTAKKADTRAKRVAQFVGMLERHELVHP